MFFKILLFAVVAELCLARYVEHEAPDLRIVSGDSVYPKHSAPWMVYLGIRDSEGWLSTCGGSLISKDHVLTAAHCVAGDVTVESITLGVYDLKEWDGSEQEVKSDGIFVHDQYNSATHENDIAIIRLKTSATLTNEVQVVTLAPATDANATYAGKFVSIYGWGLVDDITRQEVDQLQVASVPVMPREKCYDTAPHKDVYKGDLCTDTIMARSICDGDSGGPVMLRKRIQVGVISRLLTLNCYATYPSVHAKVGYYRRWIDSTMSKL